MIITKASERVPRYIGRTTVKKKTGRVSPAAAHKGRRAREEKACNVTPPPLPAPPLPQPRPGG